MDQSRRSFLGGRPDRSPPPVRPPWAPEKRVAERCTGCAACARACPEQIIVLRGGLAELDFSRGECTFCGLCAEACGADVFTAASDGPAFSHVARLGDACLAGAGVVCQVCADACPERAIRFRLRLGAVPAPALEPDHCTGCGACIASCPAGAIEISRHREGAIDA